MNPLETTAVDQATAATAALRNLAELRTILAQLSEAQNSMDKAGLYDTKLARSTEAAMGYVRMALEAVDN